VAAVPSEGGPSPAGVAAAPAAADRVRVDLLSPHRPCPQPASCAGRRLVFDLRRLAIDGSSAAVRGSHNRAGQRADAVP
jgi:hypothetical protein